MPPVLHRSVYVVAGILLGVSLLAIRYGAGSVAHRPVTLPGGAPAVVYEPGPPRSPWEPRTERARLPVVVLAHGFAANKGAMGSLARRLARAGYAVVTFDFRGHGANRARLGWGWSPEGLYEDVDAAVRYATTSPRFDPERLILMGHSMGAGAVLGHASREPGSAAVVAISGGFTIDGPHPVPNALLIWASRDPSSIRTRAREIGAEIAGLERLVLDRRYGDPARGTAVRASEVEGTDHLTILYSSEAARRIVGWLDETVGGAAERRPGGESGVWVLTGMLGGVVLLFGLTGRLAPVAAGPATPGPSGWRAPLVELAISHGGALLLIAGWDPFSGGSPFGVLPLRGGGAMAWFFLTSGALHWLVVLLRRAPVGASPPGLRAWTVGAALGLAGYLVLTGVLSPLWDLRLPPHRVGWAVLGAALLLPFFAVTEERLRPRGGARWVSPVGKGVTLLAIGVGASVGVLPFVVLLGLGGLVGLFVLFEVVGDRLALGRAHPGTAAVAQAIWAGWFLGVLFPIAG